MQTGDPLNQREHKTPDFHNSVTGQETAENADSSTEYQEAGRKQQKRIRYNYVYSFDNPGQSFSHNGTEFAKQSGHSRFSRDLIPPI